MPEAGAARSSDTLSDTLSDTAADSLSDTLSDTPAGTPAGASSPSLSAMNRPLMFPTLTPAQIARLEAVGVRRPLHAGDVLVEVGARNTPWFVILSGRVAVLRADRPDDPPVAVHERGGFTGDTNILLGRRALLRSRILEEGEAVEMTREQVLNVVQTDPEMSDILMRAFIARRLELIERHFGDALLIGSMHSAATLRIREFLTRNGHPFEYIDLDRDQDTQAMLDRFHVTADEIPVLICRGTDVLRHPTNAAIADCLGLNREIDPVHMRDVVIIGAGPSGLAAAVYAASEGLDVLVVEANAPGGQAAASSKIENYLGFPAGVTGQELAGRAFAQAEKFGADIVIAKGAAGLACARRPYVLQIDDGTRVPARAVIIATGAEYRRPAIENLARFEGMGVYYGATFIESQLCAGEEVIVVGGGNSAGQAAAFLSKAAGKVHMLVRAAGLAESMSRYLIRRIEDSPAIELRTSTEIVALEGAEHLERVCWRDTRTGATETRDIRHVFMMTGAAPNTGWLNGCVALDGKGFVRTGMDLSRDDLTAARWPLARAPYLLETTLPAVFAVGDVRGGNVKRVASAVGEGSIAISFVHRVLSE
jgi:thioredoxin reductase (NADPH)